MADDRYRDHIRFGRPLRDKGYSGNPGGDAVYGRNGVYGGDGSGGASDFGRESEWNHGGRQRDRNHRHEHPRWSSDDDRMGRATNASDGYRRRDAEYREPPGYTRIGYGRPRDDESERGWFVQAGDEVASWFGNEDAETRRQADQHRGRGPKGYQRSDERILEDVNDWLTDDPFLDATDIEVSVSGGEVTLSGVVADRQGKRRAEDIAEIVSGVSHVQNNLRVQGGGAGSASGSDQTAPRTVGASLGSKIGNGGARNDA
jgi:osmotically-inducible protein OsmY